MVYHVHTLTYPHHFSLTYEHAGCNNGNSQSPDLTDVDGICFFIDSNSGDEVSEWYYGGSIMNKSGRYIYGDGKSTWRGKSAAYSFVVVSLTRSFTFT